MKIALVKQDIYPDLYVFDKSGSPAELLESTLMRIGPLGLFSDYDTDFFIIKEQFTPECQAYRYSQDINTDLKEALKATPANKLEVGLFSFLNPLSTHSHADFAKNPEDVNWEEYDIVISVNVAIPTKVIKKYPNTLWCYMYGEANAENSYPDYGYDCLLTQNITGEVVAEPGVIDFPYTFLTSTTLENIAREKFAKNNTYKRNGIYAEINNTTKRPVTECPCLENVISKLDKKVPLFLHNQNILVNLENLYKSKYFVKLQGRKIRGNSVIEAISAGCVVLMNPKDVIHSQLLPVEAWIHNEQELIDKINYLEANKKAYLELLHKEKELVDFFVVKTPMESLKNALEAKRNGVTPAIPTFKQKLRKALKLIGLKH